MMRTIALVVLLASTAVRADLGDVKELARREMAAGDELVKKGDYQGAIPHYQTARRLAPGTGGPAQRIGTALVALGKCAEAIPFLEEYQRRKPPDLKTSAAYDEMILILENCREEVARQQPAPAPAAPRPAAAGSSDVGYLVANTQPWAKILIDGEDTGLTTPVAPRYKIPLAPGKHVVSFVVRDARVDVEVVIKAGEDTRLFKTLAVPPVASPPAASAGSSEPPPPQLDKRDIIAGMNGIRDRVAACYDAFKTPGLAMIDVEIANDGTLSSAKISGQFERTETGYCVEKAVKPARFSRFSGPAIRLRYPFMLR